MSELACESTKFPKDEIKVTIPTWNKEGEESAFLVNVSYITLKNIFSVRNSIILLAS